MQTALLPHLILKDLRHVRLLIGLWLFLLVAQGALIGSGFSSGPGDMVWQFAYMILAIGIPILQALVIIILLPILIQDEPLVGTTGFWFTRPISRGTVLAAKALFAVAFLVIPPLVVEVLVFVANGIESRDILRVLPQVLYGSIGLIVPVMALCTLTRTFARFALWIVVLWVSMTVFAFVVQIGRLYLHPESFVADSQDLSLALSKGIAGGLCTIALGTILIVHQYLTRRTRVSLVILFATLVVSLAVQSLWTYDFLKRPDTAASQATFPADTAIPSLTAGSIYTTEGVQLSLRRDPHTNISARIGFANVPPGYQLKLSRIDSTLTFPDGTRLDANNPQTSSQIMAEWSPDALSHAIGGMPVANANTDGADIRGQVFDLETSVFQQRKSEPAVLQAKLDLKVEKLEVLGRLPLRNGGRIDDGSRHIELTSVLHQTAGCRLLMRERKVNLWSSETAPQFNPLATKSSMYLLVNRERNQAILPDENMSYDMVSSMLQASTRLINRSFFLDFTGSRRDKDGITIDEAWLAGAELVLVEARPAGTLERKLTVENFVMEPKK